MTMEGVLFVDHTTILGGAELSLARYLRSDLGSSSAIAFLSPHSAEPWKLPASVQAVHTRGEAGTTGIRELVRELSEIIDWLNPRVVVANSFSAAQYLAFVPKRGRTYAYFLRQEALPEGLSKVKSVLNRTFVLRRFDYFLANSEWTASTLPASVDRSRVLLSRPISGIQVGSDPADTVHSGATRLLAMSRLSPWKGVHTAIEAVRILNQDAPSTAQLTVAGGDLFGEAEYSTRLRGLADGQPVHFVGHQDDTAPLLRGADVLLCLSVTPEPFGQVVVQGLANGRIVIATDQGGPREIIQHGVSGFLVPPESPGAVAAVVAALRADTEMAARVSAAARRRAGDFVDSVTIPHFHKALVEISKGADR